MHCFLNAYTLAVAEENGTAGADIVTAPTCGAAGIVPGVFYYIYEHELNGMPEEEKDACMVEALAVAGVIGNLARLNASISGAEAGCAAEVGVATAMASAGACYLTIKYIDKEENNYGIAEFVETIQRAAKLSLTNKLGLSCDPVAGRVICPCVNRNVEAAMTAYHNAINATTDINDTATSFDGVLKSMYETGKALDDRFRETSRGGLAVNCIQSI